MVSPIQLFIDKRIDKYYSLFCIKRSLSGSVYLAEALKLSFDDDRLLHQNITTKLYPKIAQKYEVSPSQVEKGIRHLITVCYNNDSLRANLVEFLNVGSEHLNSYYKPSNSELISLCYWKLKIRLEEEGYL